MTEFEKIYKDNFSLVYRYVFSLCRNESLAEEITQEAFYKAMKHLDKFDGNCKLDVWLCQIAKNTYYTVWKKQKKTVNQEQFDILETSDATFESKFSDKETSRLLHRFLHELKEPYKEVFSLRVFGELPFSQIGELFGKTDSWARLIFHRAKIELRRRLDEEEM